MAQGQRGVGDSQAQVQKERRIKPHHLLVAQVKTLHLHAFRRKPTGVFYTEVTSNLDGGCFCKTDPQSVFTKVGGAIWNLSTTSQPNKSPPT